MPRYYFHIKDGHTILDAEGTELPDIAEAKKEALGTAGQMLGHSKGDFWNGTPWCMWVTDAPGGGGKTLFTLRFTADDGAS